MHSTSQARFTLRTLVAAAALSTLALQASAAPVKVLFLGYDANVTNVKNDLLGSDARFDLAGSSANDACGASAPTLGQLQQYDSVLVWGNCGPAAGLGNVLADYADAGGRVVLSTFLGYFAQNGQFSGRINSQGYNPFTGGTQDAYHSVSLGSHDSGHALFDGVGNISATYFNGDWLGVDAGATLVASWSNNRPFVGVNAAGNVLNVSLFPNVAQYGHASGDYRQLFRNALAYEGQSSQAVPEPATWGLALVALLGAGAARRRKAA